ncbi:MAG: redoxin domain-containing protein [Acidimicrobiaceae bacterium]|nr:redoxin domain-containing protein [Acidimicrobiaceae bacterium]
MTSPFARYSALAVLLVGLAAIAWVALRNSDTVDSTVSSNTVTTVDGDAVDGDTDAASTDTDTDRGSVPSTGQSAATTPSQDDPESDSAATHTDPDASDPVKTPKDPTSSAVREPIEILGEADTLTDLDGWLNTDANSLEEIRAANTLTVVQFWTFGCYNCKNTLEALQRLYADFGDRGVEIVGVHSPEFSYEKDVDNIIEAAAELGVTWPIALDTHKRNFHRWQEGPTAYWPRVYVIDSDNRIRYDKRGDRAATYQRLYEIVEQLLMKA